MRLNVLQRWWPRSEEQSSDCVDQARPQRPALTTVANRVAMPCRYTTPETETSNPVIPASQAKIRRARKAYKVGSLENRETLTTAKLQAALLLCEIADKQPQRVGEWVPHEEIEARYTELANRNNWTILGWIPISIAIKEWTQSERITRNRKKRTRYRIPRITPNLRRRADLVQNPTIEALVIATP
jgi:hypothetical protein